MRILLIIFGLVLIVSSPLLWQWFASLLQEWTDIPTTEGITISGGVMMTCILGGISQVVVGAFCVVCAVAEFMEDYE